MVFRKLFITRTLFASIPLVISLKSQQEAVEIVDETNERPRIHVVDYSDTIYKCSTLIEQAKLYCGAPGVSISVHVNGQKVWEEGFGYADVENAVPCTPSTVMRIASISKFITSIVAMKLYQNSQLDLDQNISTICNNLTSYTLGGNRKEITTRQLLSHTSGIRHYKGAVDSDSESPEFISSKHFDNVKDSLSIFEKDELLFEPGSDFNYTTFGYSVLSYVIETVSGRDFMEIMKNAFTDLGMYKTYFELNSDLINSRAKFYQFKDNKLKNCPYVDNSLKWAGGGLMSTVQDLARLGNIFLYCLQSDDPQNYLSLETIQTMINNHSKCKSNDPNRYYGLGVSVQKNVYQSSFEVSPASFCHTGGAVGATSNLFILPIAISNPSHAPSGIVVAIFCNLESGGPVSGLAKEIAVSFRDANCSCDECY